MHPERWFDVVRLRLRSLVRRGTVESELNRELRFHLEEEMEKNQRLGLAPAEARTAALRRLGGVAQIQEECRDMRRTGYLESLAADLRYAARMLAKAPGFAVVMVLTLGLAIGANSAIFSVIDGVLLRPLPYPRPDRLARIFMRSANYPQFPLNPFDLRDIRSRSHSFTALAGMTRGDRQLSGIGEPVRLAGFRVTAGYFRVLGVSPALGRDFTSQDELPGAGNRAMLSERLWRTRFAADPAIVGRKIVLDGEPFTVAGVMPPVAHPGNNYHAVADGDTVDLWTPFTYEGDGEHRGSHYMEAIARLKDGVSLQRAQADLEAQVAQLAREHPDNMSGWQPMVVSLYQEMVGGSRQMLLVLFGAVGLVLLIACANAANLLLARATVRQREIAVRAALGAGRWRLARQMLAESLLIALLGGALGALLADGGVRALIALVPPGFPRAASIHVNGAVFAFTVAIALGTGVLFGLAPALRAARPDLQQALREGGRGASGGGRQLRLRNVLVAAEVSLACVLLAAAGLLLRSFVNMARADAGFRAERVVTAVISVPQARYKTAKDMVSFYDRLDRALGALPGVQSAGLGSDLPWTGYNDNIGGFLVEGKQPPPGRQFHARYHVATANYFRALGIPLERGRFFDAHDDIKGRPVIIINQAMARFWQGDDPVGGRISFDDQPKEPNDWFTVVGVVGDVKDHPASAEAQPAFWWSMQQLPNSFDEMSIAVRAAGTPAPLAAELRGAVHGLDPELAVAELKLMDEIAGRSFSTARFTLFLVALFAGLAAALAGVGIYGVISYSVSRRAHEFGLRMALGANAWDVVRQVMGQGIRVAMAGVAVGIAGALALGRVLWSLLYQVSPSDPPTILAVAVCALAIAALACYIPARRATAADPVAALRME